MDRRRETAQARFRDGVEWVRAGTIFAQSDRQYRRWQSAQKRTGSPGGGLTGAGLEKVIGHIRAAAVPAPPGAKRSRTKLSVAEWNRQQVAYETVSPDEWARRQDEVAAARLVPHPAGLVR